MTYCRICGDPTSVYVCGKCVDQWRVLVHRAAALLPAMFDEVARTSAKGKAGGDSGGRPEAVSLGALEAKSALTKALYRLYTQLGVTSPQSARENLHKVQETPRDTDALYDDFTALQEAVKLCASMVEVRETIIGVGLCTCGYQVYAFPSASTAKCRQCGHKAPVEVFAEQRRLNALARSRGRRLSREEAELLIRVALPGCKPGTVRQWFARHLRPDETGRYPEPELRAFIESRAKKYATALA